MVNIHDYFDSEYLKAGDLRKHGRPAAFALTIARIEQRQFKDEPKPTLIVMFREAKKGLRLNKTNASILSELYGPETDNWIDRVITIGPEKTQYQGRMVDCVRVLASPPLDTPRSPGVAAATTLVAPVAEPGFGPAPEEPEFSAGEQSGEIPF